MPKLAFGQPKQFARGNGAGHRDIDALVPTALTEIDRAAHRARHFVTEYDRQQQLRPGAVRHLGGRQRRWNEVAGMERAQGDVRVVVVEEADHHGIGECREGPVRSLCRFRAPAPRLGADGARQVARNVGWRTVEATKRASDGIQ